MIDWITILVLILTGITFIIIEIIFIPGTTVVGVLGFVIGGYGVFASYEKFGTDTGHIILVSTTVVTLIVTFISFKSEAWKRFANNGSIKSKVNEGYAALLNEGDEGQTVSSLKPIGKALFGEKEYEVASLGNFILEKTAIKIIKIETNKIIVEPI